MESDRLQAMIIEKGFPIREAHLVSNGFQEVHRLERLYILYSGKPVPASCSCRFEERALAMHTTECCSLKKRVRSFFLLYNTEAACYLTVGRQLILRRLS